MLVTESAIWIFVSLSQEEKALASTVSTPSEMNTSSIKSHCKKAREPIF